MTGSKPNNDDLAWTVGSHCLALDGIRGLAILVVTIYRFCQMLEPKSVPWIADVASLSKIGSRGVDLFFVLSGFLITGILLKTKSKPCYLRNFYVRRTLRIFPLYFLSLLLFLFIVPWLTGTKEFERPLALQGYLWTYTSNLYMSWVNQWCFGPMDHFWSLAIEEHFYLVWPLIVLWLSRKSLAWFTIAGIAAVVTARTFTALFSGTDVSLDVFTLFRADSLLIGAFLAQVIDRIDYRPWIVRFSWIGLPVLAILIAIARLLGQRWLELPNTLCPLFCFCFMAIVLLSRRKSAIVSMVSARHFRVLGKYSYGMYVIQLPLASLLPFTVFCGIDSNLALGSVVYVMGMSLVTLGLAMVSYHAFEVYFLRMKDRFSSEHSQ
ncbi:MAG: acyltransferase [Pirellulaceae bacterium]|nr:acyltransferase [Pirellulaceae bacterium]